MQETITWHLYKDEKPKKDRRYLVLCDEIIEGELVRGSTFLFWKRKDFSPITDIVIIAWAEMPKGIV